MVPDNTLTRLTVGGVEVYAPMVWKRRRRLEVGVVTKDHSGEAWNVRWHVAPECPVDRQGWMLIKRDLEAFVEVLDEGR